MYTTKDVMVMKNTVKANRNGDDSLRKERELAKIARRKARKDKRAAIDTWSN